MPGDALLDFFRCPAELVPIGLQPGLSVTEGYFEFGGGLCYGRSAGVQPAPRPDRAPDVTRLMESAGSRLQLPFDFDEVVANLRGERYQQGASSVLRWAMTGTSLSRRVYYALRPALPVPVRKHLQRVRLAGWERIAFPRWPVDLSVETLMQNVMTLALRAGVSRVPFIWFWPDGAPGCVMMTHDVETSTGGDFCGQLMDLDDSFGVKSAFQLVPEPLGPRSDGLWEQIRDRGFEVNLHDLNHDGSLFDDHTQFLERAAQINRYARVRQCGGFRSGAMYRRQEWFDAFEFSYDMSVPNVAHLEPQRGGCCTIMPYFVGNVLELPLTTTQDYSLFHIIGDYSIDLWKRQTTMILSRNGLASFIVHPDYVREQSARAVYRQLLAYLADLRSSTNVWMALPADIDRWWRSRRAMSLVPDGESWRVVGPGSERARLAYATLQGDDIVYTLDEHGQRPS